MPTLYNCKHSGDQYRISKFDSDFNLEASYLCDLFACECPAGHRPTCRHRQMLPKFIARNAVGTEWFWDHDRGGLVQGWKEEPAIDPYAMETNPNDEPIASEALPIQPMTEPSTSEDLVFEEEDDEGSESEPSPINHIYAEEDCPSHVASDGDPKICKWCGVHADSLRPDDDYIHEGEFPINSLAPAGLGQASDPSLESYGISPMITEDLPVIREYNEQTRLRNQAAEQRSPLLFDKDHSNSIGHSPGYDALRPSPSPTIRRRV